MAYPRTSDQERTLQDVEQNVVTVIAGLTRDWGHDTPLSGQTRLVNDLEFESIDVIQLVVALEEHFATRNLGFDKLLINNGRYVDDLTITQIARFLHGRLQDGDIS